LFRPRLHILAFLLANEGNADLDEVAHDLLDVAANVANLGEFGCFNLEERRAGKLGQAPGNLSLADASGAYHQDVFRQHFFSQFIVELLAPPTIAQSDRDRALGVALANDETVKLGNDFAGGEVGQRAYPVTI
jgi:hypothetical protein